MKTIEETYCTFEQAKLLKEKGFPQDKNSDIWDGNGTIISITIPTLSSVQRWFMKKKNISILPFINLRKDVGSINNSPKYCPELYSLYSNKILNFEDYKNPDMNFDNYEEALSAGINKVLELI